MRNIKCYDLLLEPVKVYDKIKSFKLSGPNDIVDLVNELYHLNKANREKAIIVGFDASGAITGMHQISAGLVSSTKVSPDQAFKFLLLTNSRNFILFHNHPSNNCAPSRDDEGATARMIHCARLMNINMLDHIIITRDSYCSLKKSTAVFDIT